MPAHPVAVWPDVKATAISTGSLEEAARLHGIASGTVRQRAKRESWPVGRRVHTAAAEAVALSHRAIVQAQAQRGIVTNVTSAAEAALAVNADNSRRSRTAALRYAAGNLEHLAELPAGEEAIAHAPNAAALVKMAAQAGDWAQVSGATVRIDIYSATERVVEGSVVEQPESTE